jgi:hypothetical protein
MPPASVGFDTSVYPGDPAMRDWKTASPYSFAGYYLKAPCHRDAGFTARRASLDAMGWKLVPIYVGQQMPGVSPCASSILTAAQGALDGADAACKLASEGFGAATYVYLDIEHCDTFSPELGVYIGAWGEAVDAAGYRAAAYCHKHNALDVRAALAAHSPRFWIVGGSPARFNLTSASPADSGIAFADLWQCPVSASRNFGGHTILLDENISCHTDPST